MSLLDWIVVLLVVNALALLALIIHDLCEAGKKLKNALDEEHVTNFAKSSLHFPSTVYNSTINKSSSGE